MTDKAALEKLITDVEAGEYLTGPSSPSVATIGIELTRKGHAAFHGSLDAARALHDALLPGWRWYAGKDEHSVVMTVSSRHGTFSADGEASVARAWLLAILKAKLAEADG